MTEHASVVKNVHKVLRNKFKTGLSEDAIWSEHMQDEKILQEYSASMHSLASLTWKKDENNRIEWCKGVIKNYYKDCLLYTSPSPRDKRQSRMPSSA